MRYCLRFVEANRKVCRCIAFVKVTRKFAKGEKEREGVIQKHEVGGRVKEKIVENRRATALGRIRERGKQEEGKEAARQRESIFRRSEGNLTNKSDHRRAGGKRFDLTNGSPLRRSTTGTPIILP
ncbi:hypothetical protein K0M31_009738 [Melipona bicolor]|uniref:Uncharacterized protein n=1 Tax=Melipona bicolor TaxID=60889 RepID=A0AA40FMG5_9HYME|nr:hypothetical protein K0M31_009738 [Melipona bicolor]